MESSIRSRGLRRRETPRKDRSIYPKPFLRSKVSDVELDGTSGFHQKILLLWKYHRLPDTRIYYSLFDDLKSWAKPCKLKEVIYFINKGNGITVHSTLSLSWPR